LRMAAAERGLRLAILPDGSAPNRPEAIYEALRRESYKPAVLLAASTDARIQSLCASLAVLAEVPFVALEQQAFPRAVATMPGQIKLCESVHEFLTEILRSDPAQRLCLCTHQADIGWSRLWQIIEARIRASQLERAFEQKSAEPKPRGRRQRTRTVRAVPSGTRRAEPVTLDGTHS